MYDFPRKYHSMDTDCVFIFVLNSYDKYRLRISKFYNFCTKFADYFDAMQPNKTTSVLKITGGKLSVAKLRINCTLFIPLPPDGIAKFTKWWGTQVPAGWQPAATWVNTTRYCKYSQVLLMMGENIARNM